MTQFNRRRRERNAAESTTDPPAAASRNAAFLPTKQVLAINNAHNSLLGVPRNNSVNRTKEHGREESTNAPKCFIEVQYNFDQRASKDSDTLLTAGACGRMVATSWTISTRQLFFLDRHLQT